MAYLAAAWSKALPATTLMMLFAVLMLVVGVHDAQAAPRAATKAGAAGW